MLVRKDVKLFLIPNQTVAALKQHVLLTFLKLAFLPYDEADPPSSVVRQTISYNANCASHSYESSM